MPIIGRITPKKLLVLRKIQEPTCIVCCVLKCKQCGGDAIEVLDGDYAYAIHADNYPQCKFKRLYAGDVEQALDIR